MSTRANVIIESKKYSEKLYFYRHSDGYPKGTMPSLQMFMKWLKEGKIRDNISQAAGWLVLIGAIEYGRIPAYEKESHEGMLTTREYGDVDSIKDPDDWKVGAYEPTTDIHGDVEFIYTIDLDDKTINCQQRQMESWEPLKMNWVDVNILEYLKLQP